MSNIKLGADPEFFLRDTQTGKLVSAHGMIPGTKANPHKVKCGAVQVDGMAIEFNIDPASSGEEFAHNITTVLAELREMIDDRYAFVFESVAEFGDELIQQQPDEAKELGCEPDYNVWTNAENPQPDAKANFRTAAGHIHIGWGEGFDTNDADHIEACTMFARQLDYEVGLAQLAYDPDIKRSSLYGKLGTIRIKSYGLEYRTPANSWLRHPEIWVAMFNNISDLFDEMVKGGGNETFKDRRKMSNWVNRINYPDIRALGISRYPLDQKIAVKSKTLKNIQGLLPAN